jgi:hypothetical protein
MQKKECEIELEKLGFVLDADWKQSDDCQCFRFPETGDAWHRIHFRFSDSSFDLELIQNQTYIPDEIKIQTIIRDMHIYNVEDFRFIFSRLRLLRGFLNGLEQQHT